MLYEKYKDILWHGTPEDFEKLANNDISQGGDNFFRNMDQFARWCIDRDRMDIMAILINKYQYDIYKHNEETLYWLFNYSSVSMLELLDYNDLVKNPLNANNINLFEIACYLGDTEKVKWFLNNGFNPNVNLGKPLINAVGCDSEEIVKLLIDAGADINASKCRALEEAINDNNYEMIKLLLNNGADVSYINGRKPQNEMINLLLDSGIDSLSILSLIEKKN